MARYVSLNEARRRGFTLDYAKENDTPLEWAEAEEKALAEAGWGKFEIILVHGMRADGLGESKGSTIAIFATQWTHANFKGTVWHEAGHGLIWKYGMEGYPRPPIKNALIGGFNMFEVAAEDFRQTFGPPEAAARPHKYDSFGYGLGYNFPPVVQELGDWKALRDRIRRWWLINCNEEFVEAQKSWMTLTWEKIERLLRRLTGKQ